MVTTFDDASLIQYHDNIRVLNSRKTMGNDKDRSAFHQLIHTTLDDGLGSCINTGCCLVKNQYRRICDGCTRNGQKLTLTLRKLGTVAA